HFAWVAPLLNTDKQARTDCHPDIGAIDLLGRAPLTRKHPLAALPGLIDDAEVLAAVEDRRNFLHDLHTFPDVSEQFARGYDTGRKAAGLCPDELGNRHIGFQRHPLERLAFLR